MRVVDQTRMHAYQGEACSHRSSSTTDAHQLTYRQFREVYSFQQEFTHEELKISLQSVWISGDRVESGIFSSSWLLDSPLFPAPFLASVVSSSSS